MRLTHHHYTRHMHHPVPRKEPTSVYFQGDTGTSSPSTGEPPTADGAASRFGYFGKLGNIASSASFLKGSTQRLKNGVSEVFHLFKRDRIGETAKRLLVFTTVLTLMTSIFATPIGGLLSIPAHVGLGLAWETVQAFFGGVWRKPDPPAKA